jgi:hypothetical protein
MILSQIITPLSYLLIKKIMVMATLMMMTMTTMTID